ncbi:TlpA family protein disulfide reductase [Ornithinimicrobium cavernae]|uniref:TlpA family protein disulfide reductase n=1 Tax=Ornithinimicrobium cavernae TaxID=2666047 RepID=UPI000D68B5A1|nr:MauE/DoxX family redox-associated membrane protein [Ornithinimicrobium cavernae]
MQITAVLTAWVVLAAVLAASGVGKLRHPEGATEAFTALRVPAALSRPWMVRAHPWAEPLLAAGLLTLPHPATLVAAALTLALLTAYLLVVWRVVASGEEVTCSCFGSVGAGTVDGWTVARNALLVLVGGLVVVDAVLGGSAPARFADLGPGWWWVAGLAVTAAMTYLVVRPARSPEEPAAEPAPVLRLPVPDARVRLEERGELVPLAALADGRPQLLLLLSPGCGPCRMLSGRLADWDREVPTVGFRVAHAVSFAAVRDSLPEWKPFFVQDVDGSVGDAFGDPARPWAVLLGTDGRLASAPAQGFTGIVRLVEDLRTEVEAATAAEGARPAPETPDNRAPATGPAQSQAGTR